MFSYYTKLKRSLSYYYWSRKNDWTFPSNMAHSSGGRMADGSYEPGVSSHFAAILGEGDVCLDVGANMGFFSRLSSELVGPTGAVFAFEVDPMNYSALTQNVRTYPNVNALHFAVSKEDGFTEMNFSSHSSTHSIVDTGNLLSDESFSVPAMALDTFWKTFIKDRPIQLAKIDVEGAEMMVLDGMDFLLKVKLVRNMIIEYCPRIMQNAGFDTTAYYERLSGFFDIRVIDEDCQTVVQDGRVATLADFRKLTDHLLGMDGAANSNLLCSVKA